MNTASNSQNFQSAYLQCMKERGFLYQCTDYQALDESLCNRNMTAYIGFDLTADSLHIGSLVQIMCLKWWQSHGHKPLIVLGCGTTKIGDPSGKDQARQMLSPEQIDFNKKGIASVFERYLTFGNDSHDAAFVDNADWLDGLSYIELLREVGPHFSINKMLGFESVKSRLDREQNLSFLEFNYMILQAYDFVELSKRMNCQVQMGGSDQWGNIVSGIELGRRLSQTKLFGITAPLLTTASGAKMGKTANGAVWLDEKKTSVYDFWQYWRNVEDADVIRFFKCFTCLSLDEIKSYENLQGQAINEAKIRLANEVTALCHGKEKTEQASNTAKKTFMTTEIDDNLPTFDFTNQPETTIRLSQIIQTLGFAESSSAARRLIQAGAVKFNDKKIIDVDHCFTKQDSLLSSAKLQVGKKKVARLILTKD